MQFSGLELSSLIKMADTIAGADGKFLDEEKAAIALGMAEFGLDAKGSEACLTVAQTLEPAQALGTLSGMTTDQKKYATGYLAFVMAADGDVDPAEIKLWQLISTLASFPTMKFPEALNFWKTH